MRSGLAFVRTGSALAVLLAPLAALAFDLEAGAFLAPHYFHANNELAQVEGLPVAYNSTVAPGARIGLGLLPFLALEAEALVGVTTREGQPGATLLGSARGHLVGRIGRGDLRGLLLAGGGIMSALPTQVLQYAQDTDGYAYGGGGAVWQAGKNWIVRLDLRLHLTGSNAPGQTLSQEGEATLGLVWRWGAEKPTQVVRAPEGPGDDADGDGVKDAADRCPFEAETKNGVRDEDGCPEHESQLLRYHRTVYIKRGATQVAVLPEVGSGGPAGPARPEGEAAKPAEVAKPAEPAKPAEVAKPAEPAKPAQAVKPAETAKPAEVLQPAAAATPVVPEPTIDDLPPEENLAPNALPPLVSPFDDDGDGYALADDVCPDKPEDFDGFADGDGCPDLDNDEDGVPDTIDACPLVGETANGFEDDDGCPDVVPPPLAALEGTLEGVYFDTGKASLQARSGVELKKVVDILRTWPRVQVEIGGHTDDVGAREANLALSEARAAAVRAWLVRNGADARRIAARGYGPDRPKADNATPEGKARNRRVEFRLVPNEPRREGLDPRRKP